MAAQQFRKKPIVIEALQWTGFNELEMSNFIVATNYTVDRRLGLIIHTLEGNLHTSLNDWIIKGIKGEFYPCKPDIFEVTYELV